MHENQFTLREFEPGDGTRYFVAWALLDHGAAEKRGHGDEPAIYFAFGSGGRPLVAFTFHTRPSFLSFEYFRQKMEIEGSAIMSGWTLNAAYQVCLFLTGRTGEPGTEREDGFMPIEFLGWDANWRDQLTFGARVPALAGGR